MIKTTLIKFITDKKNNLSSLFKNNKQINNFVEQFSEEFDEVQDQIIDIMEIETSRGFQIFVDFGMCEDSYNYIEKILKNFVKCKIDELDKQ